MGTIRPEPPERLGDDAADEKKELDRCAGMRYNENSHSSPSQAICGGFVCTGIRCREQLNTGHSAQRGKNLKGLAAVESISVLEAARQLGRSKNTVKYWVRKLPPETVSKDEKGRLWISSAGLELLREQLKAAPDEPDEHNHQEPDERTTHFSGEPPRTGRKPPKNHPQPDEKPDESHLEPDEKPPTTTQRTTAAEQLDALREQLDHLRDDLSAAQQAAAVATAERDAERRRADAAELREREQAQTVTDLTAALRTAQQQAADLTAALTAAQALHAGTIQERLAMQDGEPIAAAAPAPDQSDTKTAEPVPDDQPGQKRRGFFARLFGKS